MKLEQKQECTRLYVVGKAIFDILEELNIPRYQMPIDLDRAKYPNVEWSIVAKSRRIKQETDDEDYRWIDPFVVYGHYEYAIGDDEEATRRRDLLAHNIEKAFATKKYPSIDEDDPAVDTADLVVTIDEVELFEAYNNVRVDKKGIGAVCFLGEVRSQIEWRV